MLVPMSWLAGYTEIKAGIDEFCDRMIMSGSNIETVENFGEGIEKVVVGKITRIERHPNADKLLVAQVDIGSESIQIVTGATNIFEGACIPVILPGGVLPNGTVIRKGMLRDVESNGMMCSAKELGMDDKVIPVADRDGIMILDREYPLGMDVLEALQLKEQVVEFEITPNRPDCLSMLGMAREAAAVFRTSLAYPDTTVQHEEGKSSDYIDIEIRNPELCRRYTGRIVTDVRIARSPWWLQKRLITAGMRPINNIVDITNYVMLEYGQPIHAFDLRDLAGRRIIVDTAEQGQTFTTLDGAERILSADTLMINDGEKAVAIAGIMGGRNSEIKDDTTTILIESANFNGDNIRSSSKKLGLRTEASARFEKGIDANLCLDAADRVCRLIELTGAGTVAGGAVDIYPTVRQAAAIDIRPDRINALLGVELAAEEMCDILERLEMKTVVVGDRIRVTPPTVRQDLNEEIDYVEEIARMYGYDRLPVTLPKGNVAAGKPNRRELRDMARDTLAALGMNEIQTYSFGNPKGLDSVNIPQDAAERKTIRLLNPLGEDTSVMRTTLLPNMMEVLGRNFSRNIAKVRAFEIGNVFLDAGGGTSGLPQEKDHLCLGAYGQGESFFTLKGVIEELLSKLGVKETVFRTENGLAIYHFGRCAAIEAGGRRIGTIGEMHPDVAERYGIESRVYCGEIDLEILYETADISHLYVPLPKYPAMTRDIALLVPEDVHVADIEKTIRSSAGQLLESVELFDIYRGKQVREGHKSAAYTLTYRDLNKTLTEEELAKVHNNVLEALKNEIGAVLRDI